MNQKLISLIDSTPLSAASSEIMAKEIGMDIILLKDLIASLEIENLPIRKKLSWVLGKITDLKFHQLDYFQDELLDLLIRSDNDALQRACLKYFMLDSYSSMNDAPLFDICVDNMLSNKAVAIRAFSVYAAKTVVLRNIELKEEFCQVLNQMQKDSAGLRSTYRRVSSEICRQYS